jgi:hypothetical protein
MRAASKVLGMDWKDARTLDDLRSLNADYAEGLTGKSLDFFYTDSPNPNVYWEVERKPFQPERLIDELAAVRQAAETSFSLI